MVAIERENQSLKGVLAKNYARPDIDKTQLGELIDLIGTIAMGDAESRSKDLLGRVYEYFLGRFASAEGKGGGEFAGFKGSSQHRLPEQSVAVRRALLPEFSSRESCAVDC
jgi:hypothetical protein